MVWDRALDGQLSVGGDQAAHYSCVGEAFPNGNDVIDEIVDFFIVFFLLLLDHKEHACEACVLAFHMLEFEVRSLISVDISKNPGISYLVESQVHSPVEGVIHVKLF